MCLQALRAQSVLRSYPFEVSTGHFLPQKRKASVLLKDGYLKDILFILVLFLIIQRTAQGSEKETVTIKKGYLWSKHGFINLQGPFDLSHFHTYQNQCNYFNINLE